MKENQVVGANAPVVGAGVPPVAQAAPAVKVSLSAVSADVAVGYSRELPFSRCARGKSGVSANTKGEMNEWTQFTFTEKGHKVSFMANGPVPSMPKAAILEADKNGDFLVTQKPNEYVPGGILLNSKHIGWSTETQAEIREHQSRLAIEQKAATIEKLKAAAFDFSTLTF